MKKYLAELSLLKKLFVVPAIVFVFFLILAGSTYWGFQSQRTILDDIFNGRYASMQSALQASQNITKAQGEVYRLITWARANYESSKLDTVAKSYAGRVSVGTELLAHLDSVAATPQLKELYDQALKEVAEYRKAASAVVDFAQVDLNIATMAVATAEQKFSQLESTLSKAERAEYELGQISYTNAADDYRDLLMVVAIVLLGAAVLSGIASVRLNKMLVEPIRATAAVISSVSEGDLTRRIEHIETRDEIGSMATMFNSMVHQLHTTLQEMKLATETIASATSEISSSTEQMAAGAQQQSAQTGEVASAVEEMTKTIVENSKNAGATAEYARKAKSAAEQGVTISKGALDAIGRNVDVAGEVASIVNRLGESSDKIGDIITVIDDIADQTNLLALNAAIEAARAGEQGRGFAVVADEVRKLAERTTTATKEIAELIKGIQGLTSQGVASMERAGVIVGENRDMTNKTAESLQGIVSVSTQVTDMVVQIAAASEEQSSASEQISKNIEAISAVTGETASGTQQIARAADDLNRQTEDLRRLISRFRLSESDAHDGRHTADRREPLDRGSSVGTEDSNVPVKVHSAFDFENARNAHRLWRMRIQKLLLGTEKLAESEVASHRDCRLGKWLFGKGAEMCRHSANYVELCQVHEKMHDEVKRSVRLWNEGKSKDAKVGAEHVYELSDRVIAALDKIEHECTGAGARESHTEDVVVANQ